MQNHKLGTEEAVNALLNDLYIDLRKRVNYWASLTSQTAQARMGYIGQHLVSVVTGFPGGKSGARGKDIVLSENEYGEIKTCSKVDQLGKCKDCNSPVSHTETACSFCQSANIERKHDSKWLISIKSEYPDSNTLDDSEAVLVNIGKPKFYYFVLFEFEDIAIASSPIVVTIYSVDPKDDGFILCMIDYFYNIKDSAPFNMWPHSLKFNLCNPKIIYKSKISFDGKIDTIYFNVDCPLAEPFNMMQYKRSKGFTDETLSNLCSEFEIEKLSNDKNDVLEAVNSSIVKHQLSNDELIRRFARAYYKESILAAQQELSKEGKCFPAVFSSVLDSF